MSIRRQKIIVPRNRNYNSGSCLISCGLVVLVIVYGGITLHILNRGELSRSNGFNRSELFPQGKDYLDTHPRFHHDLSSLILEGLPPLRADSKTVLDLKNTPGANNNLIDRINSEDTKEHSPDTDADQINELSLEEMRYLRGRMPID